MVSRLGKLFMKFLGMFAFFAVCFVALFFANGYQYDIRNKDVKRTSIIDLVSDFKEVRVLLDGKLMANFLPYQIKDLDLGSYDVDINKVGFRAWARKVKVDADIVTIVNDIILVPEKLESFITYLKLYSKDTTLVYGKSEIISFKKGGSFFSVDQFDNGEKPIKDALIDIPIVTGRVGLEKIVVLSDDYLLVYLENSDIYSYSFQSKKFDKSVLLSKASGIRVYGDKIYFIINRNLYSVDKYSLGKLDYTNLSNFLVKAGIDNYLNGQNSNYMLIGKMLYLTDNNYINSKLLPLFLNGVDNFAYFGGRDYGLLVVRSNDQERWLFLVDRKGDASLLTKKLVGSPFINDYDQIVFTDQTSVHYYDSLMGLDTVIRANQAGTELVGWYDSEGHYILKESGKVYLEDVFNANHYDLIDTTDIDKLFINQKRLFYMKLNSLFVLDWQKK